MSTELSDPVAAQLDTADSSPQSAHPTGAAALFIDPARESAIRAFLFLEARYADDARYSDWLGLWADHDVLYWVPPHEDTDPRQEVSYVYADRDLLEQRVVRWESGMAWAQNPRSRTNRIVGNVEVVADDGTSVTAIANVHIHVSRREDTFTVVGRATYRLDTVDSGFRLRQKKVVFLDSSLPVGNITFIL